MEIRQILWNAGIDICLKMVLMGVSVGLIRQSSLSPLRVVCCQQRTVKAGPTVAIRAQLRLSSGPNTTVTTL